MRIFRVLIALKLQRDSALLEGLCEQIILRRVAAEIMIRVQAIAKGKDAIRLHARSVDLRRPKRFNANPQGLRHEFNASVAGIDQKAEVFIIYRLQLRKIKVKIGRAAIIQANGFSVLARPELKSRYGCPSAIA